MGKELDPNKEPDQHGGHLKTQTGGLLKVLGALAIILPVLGSLLGAVTTYYKDSVEKSDQNFRAVTEKLVSENDAERLAAATSTGTFIKQGRFGSDAPYYSEAINILVNRISSETDFRILGAISSTLETVNKEEYPVIVQQILNIDKNLFNYEHSYKLWKDDTEDKISSLVTEIKNPKNAELSPQKIQSLNKQLEAYLDKAADIDRELLAIKTHKNLVSTFLGNYLRLSFENPIPGLLLYQNSIINSRLNRAKLPSANIKLSSISSTTVEDVDLSGSTITDTYFSYSNIYNTDFSHSTIEKTLFNGGITTWARIIGCDFSGTSFSDVFFYHAELTDTDFRGIKGLEPYHFYGADWENAIFDSDFRQRLEKELADITPQKFTQLVDESSLGSGKRDELIYSLNYQ